MKNFYFFLLLCLAIIGPVSAASISIVPSTQTVSAGQTFTLNVSVDPVGASVAGVQFSLRFNGSVVSVNSVTEGNFLKQGGAFSYFNPGTIDNVAGRLSNVYGVITTPGSSVSTAGHFVVISLTANANGISPIDLHNVIVSDLSGVGISTIPNNGTVNVGQSPLQPLYVRVLESTDPVYTNGISQVTVQVTTTGNIPVNGASINVSTTGGTFSMVSGITDPNGNFQTTYTAPGTPGLYTISATASKTGHSNGAGSDPITVNPVSSGANVSIIPSMQTVNPGQTFSINVQVDPAGAATSGVQFSLEFNGSLVRVNSVTEGNFLKQGGSTTYFNPGTINNPLGKVVDVYGAITTSGGSVSTSGVFAVISLTAISTGNSPLNMSNILVSSISGTSIPVSISNGSVIVGQIPQQLEISIIPALQTISTGKNLSIKVFINPHNFGISSGQVDLKFNESVFRVTSITKGDILGNDAFDTGSYFDNTAGTISAVLARIGPTLVPTNPGNWTMINLTVNQTARAGTYPMNITFTGIADETFTDIANIRINNGSIRVISLPGDINCDCIVNYKDLGILGAAYGKTRGVPGYREDADLNGDGIINYKDLGILGANYGRTC